MSSTSRFQGAGRMGRVKEAASKTAEEQHKTRYKAQIVVVGLLSYHNQACQVCKASSSADALSFRFELRYISAYKYHLQYTHIML